jgi:Uma2 family endonuclease
MSARAAALPWASGLWTADQFLEFYMTRPDEERWQLVDGLAMMMPPPTPRHQRIVANLERLLNDALEQRRPDLFAFGNIGVRVPRTDDFHPQPDVAVCSATLDKEYYTGSFHVVAEVISPSNTAEMIERKLELYQRQPDNLYCLTVDQDSVHVTLYARDASWAAAHLRSLQDTLKLPAFGLEASLADLYKGTPLAR